MINSYTYNNGITISVGNQITTDNERYVVLDIYEFSNAFYVIYRNCLDNLDDTQTQIVSVDVFFALFEKWFDTIAPYVSSPQEIEYQTHDLNSPCCSTRNNL
jgi:hypothetical protein